MDTTALVAAIGDVSLAAGVIGAAVLVMLVGMKAYKWVRRAM